MHGCACTHFKVASSTGQQREHLFTPRLQSHFFSFLIYFHLAHPQVSALEPPADALDASSGAVANTTTEEEYTPMTLDEKQTYEAASAAADKRVTSLEKDRDVAWHLARGNLALASNPPIRSSKVFEFMKSETDKFAQLEAAITQAKAEAAHKRRISDLAGGAWDSLESKKLKGLRLDAAKLGLTAAIAAEAKARADEEEMLRELAIEKQREV